jgi:hypothetical protein
MHYTRTKQHILEFLKRKTSSGTPLEISEAMNQAGHNLNRKQVQKQLSRMRANARNRARSPFRRSSEMQYRSFPVEMQSSVTSRARPPAANQQYPTFPPLNSQYGCPSPSHHSCCGRMDG